MPFRDTFQKKYDFGACNTFLSQSVLSIPDWKERQMKGKLLTNKRQPDDELSTKVISRRRAVTEV